MCGYDGLCGEWEVGACKGHDWREGNHRRFGVCKYVKSMPEQTFLCCATCTACTYTCVCVCVVI